jgi:hypothetical protein
MTAQPYRPTAPVRRDPVLHQLSPLHLSERLIPVYLSAFRDDEGVWRARLVFVEPDARTRETADIFHGETEAELWESVHSLRDHHFRALYTSLI